MGKFYKVGISNYNSFQFSLIVTAALILTDKKQSVCIAMTAMSMTLIATFVGKCHE